MRPAALPYPHLGSAAIVLSLFVLNAGFIVQYFVALLMWVAAELAIGAVVKALDGLLFPGAERRPSPFIGGETTVMLAIATSNSTLGAEVLNSEVTWGELLLLFMFVEKMRLRAIDRHVSATSRTERMVLLSVVAAAAVVFLFLVSIAALDVSEATNNVRCHICACAFFCFWATVDSGYHLLVDASGYVAIRREAALVRHTAQLLIVLSLSSDIVGSTSPLWWQVYIVLTLSAAATQFQGLAFERMALSSIPSARGMGQQCPVCLDDMTAASECKKLPCGHLIHASCLKQTLHFSGSCPLCRAEIVTLADHGRPSAHRTPAAESPRAGGGGGGRAEHRHRQRSPRQAQPPAAAPALPPMPFASPAPMFRRSREHRMRLLLPPPAPAMRAPSSRAKRQRSTSHHGVERVRRRNRREDSQSSVASPASSL